MNKAILILIGLGLLVPAAAMAGGDREEVRPGADNSAMAEYGYRRMPGPGVERDREPGVLVAGVLEDSPATEAGIIRGDVILAIDGNEVNSLGQIRELLATYEAGEAVEILMLRGGEERTLALQLETRLYRPAIGIEGGFARNLSGMDPDRQWGGRGNRQSGRPGNMSPGMPGFGMGPRMDGSPFVQGFAAPGHPVMAVDPGSPAEAAGLQVGDIIVAVNGTGIREFVASGAIADLEPGDVVMLDVQRPGERGDVVDVTLDATLAQDDDGDAYLGIGRLPFRQRAFMPGM